MRRYSNYGEARAMTGGHGLAAGGYVLGIIAAQEKISKSGKPMLALQIDIAEGDERGYFMQLAQSNNGSWPGTGVYYIMLPEDPNVPADDQTLRRLKGIIAAIEESNPGYTWNWDERTLRGKKIGSLWRKEEFITQQGNSAWSTKCCVLLPVDKIRSGEFQVPKDKPLAESAARSAGFTSNAGFTPIDPGTVTDDDLPF